MDEQFPKIFIILSYTFSFINASLIIYSQVFIKSKGNNSRLLKFRLFLLIAIDSFTIIIRLIYKAILDEILYELLNSIIFAFQFYVFISFILDIIDIFNQNKEYEIISPFLMSIIFYFISFPYNKFLYSHEVLIFVIQIISRVFSIICLYFYLKNILVDISNNNISFQKSNNNISLFIDVCLISLLLFNVLKLASLFYNNLYYNIIIFSSQILIKYMMFSLPISIISSFSKSGFKNILNKEKIDISNK